MSSFAITRVSRVSNPLIHNFNLMLLEFLCVRFNPFKHQYILSVVCSIAISSFHLPFHFPGLLPWFPHQSFSVCYPRISNLVTLSYDTPRLNAPPLSSTAFPPHPISHPGSLFPFFLRSLSGEGPPRQINLYAQGRGQVSSASVSLLGSAY